MSEDTFTQDDIEDARQEGYNEATGAWEDEIHTLEDEIRTLTERVEELEAAITEAYRIV